jgi:hypothetical protein
LFFQVGYNILPAAKNQLDQMNSARAVAVGLGLGAAALLAAPQADAATEIAQLAAADNRFVIIAGLFVPVLGWVGESAFHPRNRLLHVPAQWPRNFFAYFALPNEWCCAHGVSQTRERFGREHYIVAGRIWGKFMAA